MDNMFTRTEMLIGKENLDILKNSTILIIGVGGVGGTCFEALVRSGIGHFIIVDKDVVDITNLNRQILFENDNVGKSKVLCAKEKALRINSNCDVKTINSFIDENNINELNCDKIDYIVDAIDAIYSKVAIIKFANEHNIPCITSLGMAKRLDPTKLVITRLNKSTGDPLAKKMRYVLRQQNVDFCNVMCALSLEEPINNERIPASMMMVPSAAGLAIASFVIKNLIKQYNEE